MFRNPGDDTEKAKLKQQQRIYHELLAKDQEKAKELKALQAKSHDWQYGDILHRRPAKQPDYGDRDYDLNVSAESIVRIGEKSDGKSGNVKAVEKEILHANLQEAAKKERPPNSPRRMEEREEGYFIGSTKNPKGEDKHIMRLKYKTQLDEDISYKALNRDKSAFLDIQKAGIVYSMSNDDDAAISRKKKEYREALVEQRLQQDEKKRQEKSIQTFGRPIMSSYVSTSKYYG